MLSKRHFFPENRPILFAFSNLNSDVQSENRRELKKNKKRTATVMQYNKNKACRKDHVKSKLIEIICCDYSIDFKRFDPSKK